MSKLEQLINELCPNGVEFKKIKNSYTRIKGTPITAGKMKEIASIIFNLDNVSTEIVINKMYIGISAFQFFDSSFLLFLVFIALIIYYIQCRQIWNAFIL